MAEMALGYGSEYQLLRFLGHHRNYLNKEIQELLGITEEINWCDFPSDYGRKSLDGEFKGVECFADMPNFDEIKKKWKDFWPASTQPNWDAIFKINNKWYFVEAKAHEIECYSKSEKTRNSLVESFNKVCSFYKSTKTGKDWVSGECGAYQLANRLAFAYFCKENGIDAGILYISFINGFKPANGKNDSVKSVDEWNSIWKKELLELGLESHNIDDVWFSLYIDCETQLQNIF